MGTPLALENNIDIEVARYGPITSSWRLERAQAGGALPGVPSGAGQAGSVAAGQGVAGSQAAAGVSIAGTGSSNSSTGNATVSQVGPVAQTLDPSILEVTVFSHKTVPQPDIVQSITPVLISNSRVDNASIQEGFLSGGSVSLTYNNHYLNENAPTDVLNPSNAPTLTSPSSKMLHVVFDDGMVADITASELVLGGIYDFVEVFANNHRARCRMSPVNVLDVYNPKHEQFKDLYLVEKISSNEGWIPASPEEGWSLGYGRELRDFVDAVRTRRAPESGLDLAIDTTLTLYAGYVSADEKGSEVSVPRID